MFGIRSSKPITDFANESLKIMIHLHLETFTNFLDVDKDLNDTPVKMKQCKEMSDGSNKK